MLISLSPGSPPAKGYPYVCFTARAAADAVGRRLSQADLSPLRPRRLRVDQRHRVTPRRRTAVGERHGETFVGGGTNRARAVSRRATPVARAARGAADGSAASPPRSLSHRAVRLRLRLRA